MGNLTTVHQIFSGFSLARKHSFMNVNEDEHGRVEVWTSPYNIDCYTEQVEPLTFLIISSHGGTVHFIQFDSKKDAEVYFTKHKIIWMGAADIYVIDYIDNKPTLVRKNLEDYILTDEDDPWYPRIYGEEND